MKNVIALVCFMIVSALSASAHASDTYYCEGKSDSPKLSWLKSFTFDFNFERMAPAVDPEFAFSTIPLNYNPRKGYSTGYYIPYLFFINPIGSEVPEGTSHAFGTLRFSKYVYGFETQGYYAYTYQSDDPETYLVQLGSSWFIDGALGTERIIAIRHVDQHGFTPYKCTYRRSSK